MKKGLSAFLSVILLAGQLPAAMATAEITPQELVDTGIPGKKKNLIDPTMQNGFTYLCINNNASLTYSIQAGEKCVSWYVKDGFEKFQLNKTPSEFGFEGFQLSQPRDGVNQFTFTPKDGKTYVISARLRNDSKEGVVPYFGASMNNSWNPAAVIGTNEYQKTGMALDQEGWQNFKASITIPSDYTETTSNGSYAKQVYFGLGKEMDQGGGFSVDVSDRESFYFAEEQPFEMNISTEARTVFSGGGEIILSADLKNQIGISGGLVQEFDWYAIRGDRSAFAEDIRLTSTDGGRTVKASWEDSIAEGDYILAAKAKAYDFVRTFRFSIVRTALEDHRETMPENLIPDASKDYGEEYLQYNSGELVRDYSVEDGGQCLSFEARDSSKAFTPGTASGYFGAFELNSPNKSIGFIGEAQKSYVIRTRVKKTAKSGESRFGAAMNDTWSADNTIRTNEYPEGMLLTENWQNFCATITLPADYQSNALGNYSNAVYMGLPTGTVNGGFLLDVSGKDSVYFAQEQPLEIRLSCEKKDQLSAGDRILIQAEVLNQIGICGTLDQELSWFCLNEERTETVQGVELIPSEEGVILAVNRTEDLAHGLSVVAVSKKYGLVSGINPLKASHRTIYVSPNGKDQASGTRANPLKTVAGARDSIRALRRQGDTSAIDVVFLEGTYRFYDTVDFAGEDSGSETAPIIYRAAEGEKVVFTGAAELDFSSAEPVLDPDILSRLPESARGKVVSLDLSDMPYSLSENNLAPTAQQLCDYWEYPELYLEDQEQTLAQWPNGDANYAIWKYRDNTSISYTDSAPDRWENAENWWVGGYLMWDYQYVRLPAKQVSASQKAITVQTDSNFYPYEGRTDLTHRWKAFNLLEELDVPGEWYLENNRLYYYPPKGAEGKKLEISVQKQALLSLQNTDYITFSGIEFSKTRGDGIVLTNTSHITVEGCTFTGIGTDAVRMRGTKQAETDRDYWQRQDLDAAYDCVISDCIFYEIGGHAVILNGGNVDTLRPGNNVIKNCILTRCAQKIRNYDAILIQGCGNQVLHNNISRTTFQAIRFYGNNHTISYNEIHHVRQETDDTGAIYCGRNTLQRGTVISYNYLHDLLSTQELNFKHIPAIYWDDGQSGITAEYNIIENAEMDVYTNGVDQTYRYNTIVNMAQKHWYFKNASLFTNAAASNTNVDQDRFGGHIADPELYYNTYPNLKTIVEADDLRGFFARELYRLNQICNNLVVGGGANAVGTYTTNVSGNAELDFFGDFADPDHQDYRVKSGSSYAALGVLGEDFDMKQIGVISENQVPAAEISLVSPGDGEVLLEEQCYFQWDEVPGATTYTIEVARDAEFHELLEQKEVYYAHAELSLPSPDGTKYYWRITAHNRSKEFSKDWNSEIRSFQNGEKVTIDAALSEDGELSMTLINNYAQEGITSWSYLAEYDEHGALLAVQVMRDLLPYQTAMNKIGVKPRLQYPDRAKLVRLYCWNEEQEPLCSMKTLRKL